MKNIEHSNNKLFFAFLFHIVIWKISFQILKKIQKKWKWRWSDHLSISHAISYKGRVIVSQIRILHFSDQKTTLQWWNAVLLLWKPVC